jgi:uncharacterized repeat protein (TIGR02543 family)
VRATFDKALTLTLAKSGYGTGSVTSKPAGIDCGATCSTSFAKGTKITLTPAPDTGSVFTGWTGSCTGHTTCSVIMSKDITVGATFEPGSCTYTLSSLKKNVPYQKGTATITVTAKDYSYCPSPEIINNTDWITYTAGAFTNNHGPIKLFISELDSSIERTGTLTIGGKPFTLHQSGEPCTLKLSSPSSPVFPKNGGSGSFTVTMTPTDCEWTAVPGSKATWVHATISGTEVDYTVDENTGAAARTGRIVVTLTLSKTVKPYLVEQGIK